jgi:hypothetical protein
MKKYPGIIYKAGENPTQLAWLQTKKELLGWISDYVYNFYEADEDEIFSAKVDWYIDIVVDGEYIDFSNLVKPTMSLAKKAEVIRWQDAGDTTIYIKKGCDSIFEKNFGKIIEKKEFKNADHYYDEYKRIYNVEWLKI